MLGLPCYATLSRPPTVTYGATAASLRPKVPPHPHTRPLLEQHSFLLLSSFPTPSFPARLFPLFFFSSLAFLMQAYIGP